MKKSFTTTSEQEFQKTAKNIIKKLITDSRIFLLSGSLGAGKTTFVKAVAKVLGAKGEPTSPTFSLMQEYALPKQKTLYHLDLYRLSSKDELAPLELPDKLNDKNAIIFVEWPDEFMDEFAGTPNSRITITQDGERRHINIQK